MKAQTQRVVGAAWLVLAVPLAATAGQPTRQPSDGENLARGKPCSFNPAPNYRYCTDEDDPKQLTDGKYNGCVWTDKGTVGWQVGRNRVTLIDIDLGDSGWRHARSPSDALEMLKAAGVDEAIIGGGRAVAYSFMREQLIDYIVIDLQPVAFGAGTPVFGDALDLVRLKLLDSHPLNENALRLRYEVIRD